VEDHQLIAVSVPECARRCGISRALLWKILQQGKGPPLLKIGGRTLVLVEDLNEWLRARRQTQAGHGR
jgi:predicted DNA-binding transcriptional regulator AlpA